jgi:PTS system mannose-specific IIA component
MAAGAPGLLVVTHGRLAEELEIAARRIVGEVASLASISLDWDDDVVDARRRIEEGIERVAVDGRVLILTDMFGGTPSNVALSLLEPGRVDVVTGVNLPMLIKFANLHAVDGFDETVRRIAQQGRDAIQVASEVLEKRVGPGHPPGR